MTVGNSEGMTEGMTVGFTDGSTVGCRLGVTEGAMLGATVGETLGKTEGYKTREDTNSNDELVTETSSMSEVSSCSDRLAIEIAKLPSVTCSLNTEVIESRVP